MKHLRFALIFLLVLPLFSCTASSLSAITVHENQTQATGKKGSSIAFTAVEQQGNTVKAGLFMIDLDGSNRHNLTPTLNIIPSENTITGIVWSPNKQRLGFVQLGAKGTYTVYAVNADGSGLTKLFSDNQCSPASAQLNGVWSTDSQNLVFERTCPTYDGQAGYRSRTELYVSDATRAQQTRLIRRWNHAGTNTIESNIAIAPDGKQVVFFENKIAYRMKTDGTQLTQLPPLGTSNLTRRTTFVWSPDRTHLARLDQFVEKPDEQQLYLLDADGKLINQAKKLGSFGSAQLQWSPDSTRLAYYQQASPNTPSTEGNIYSLNLKGGTPKKLTQQQGSYAGLSWSPDNQQIAVTSQQGSKLYFINADGSGSIEVTPQASGLFVDPMWSADGQQIAFAILDLPTTSSKRNAETIHLYVMNRDRSGLKRLTNDRDLGVTDFAWQP